MNPMGKKKRSGLHNDPRVAVPGERVEWVWEDPLMNPRHIYRCPRGMSGGNVGRKKTGRVGNGTRAFRRGGVGQDPMRFPLIVTKTDRWTRHNHKTG